MANPCLAGFLPKGEGILKKEKYTILRNIQFQERKYVGIRITSKPICLFIVWLNLYQTRLNYVFRAY